MGDEPIRVMLVDDHMMVRSGLRTFLLVYDDLELVGEAVDGRQALALYDHVRPDVILMDLQMPQMGGVEATRRLLAQDPSARIIVLTSFKDTDLVSEALEAGARGYLLKDIEPEALVQAIRAAYRGEPVLAPEAAWALFKAARRGPALGSDLTNREREVLALLTEGLTNREIAERLVIGLATAKSHVSGVLSKLGVATRTEAVSLALQKGLLDRAPD